MFTTKPEAGEKITKLGGALAMRRRPSPSGGPVLFLAPEWKYLFDRND
jgi:hypothetical protein